MDAQALADLIQARLSRLLQQSLTDVVVGFDVSQVPRDDGTISYTVLERRGTRSLTDEEMERMRPMAQAIAEAVVEHITSHAQANDTVAGAAWRIS